MSNVRAGRVRWGVALSRRSPAAGPAPAVGAPLPLLGKLSPRARAIVTRACTLFDAQVIGIRDANGVLVGELIESVEKLESEKLVKLERKLVIEPEKLDPGVDPVDRGRRLNVVCGADDAGRSGEAAR